MLQEILRIISEYKHTLNSYFRSTALGEVRLGPCLCYPWLKPLLIFTSILRIDLVGSLNGIFPRLSPPQTSGDRTHQRHLPICSGPFCALPLTVLSDDERLRMSAPKVVRPPCRQCPHDRVAAESGMSIHSSLDRETFQQLLAAAFAVQESQIDSQSLSAVMEVQRLVTRGELDVDGAMHHIVESARNVANATGVAIGLLKGDQLIYRAGSGSTASYVGRQVNASLTVAADTNKSREILRVEDAQTDTRIEAAICRQFGARSLLILAIYHGRAVAGVLEVLFSEAHVFQDGEVRTYQLMAQQIESAIFPAVQFEQKRNPIAQLPILPHAVEQIADQGEMFPNNTGSLPLSPAQHSISQRCSASLAADRALPIRKQPSWLPGKIMHRVKDVKWLRRQRNLGLAAVSTALVLTCWIAYSGRRPVSPLESSARPTSTAIDSQARPKAAEAMPAKTTSAIQPAPTPAKKASPKVRRVRVGKNEVDYIGEDVTVRYFTYPPAPQRRPTADSRVAYIGDDVTVRYFTPTPAGRPESR